MKKLLLLLLIFCGVCQAQEELKREEDKHLPKGNQHFSEKKYAEAEAEFRQSQSKFPKKASASYNLGNSIYKIKQPSEAKFAFSNAAKNAQGRPERHKAFHNLGNSLMQEKNYEAAVQAYKNALINNPSDEESRYNFALAKKMLKENPPKNDKDKKDDKKDKKDDKGGDKDKKKNEDKNKDKDKKDDKGDSKKDKEDQKEKGQQPKPKPGGISPQRMENLLDAVNNEEKKVQDKVKGRQAKGKPVKTEKDW